MQRNVLLVVVAWCAGNGELVCVIVGNRGFVISGGWCSGIVVCVL